MRNQYPPVVELDWDSQFRIIPSKFPPINFFEGLVDSALMEEAFYIESLTNDRLREEAGQITLVQPEDRVSGSGSTPVMAAFTHIGIESRFSDGSYGIYYASKTLETAIAETRYHRTQFLSSTKEEPGEIDMRVYIGEIIKPLHDVRSSEYGFLLDSDNWASSQSFGLRMKQNGSWGLVYPSVRDSGGECIAAMRPPAISIPRQGPHLSYHWNGKTIDNVFEKKLL